jgi:hypothetical protein
VVVASLPFAPEIVIPTVRHFARLNLGMTAPYGFKPRSTRPSRGRTAHRLVGHPLPLRDRPGPVVLMIENYRSGLVWDIMRRCTPVIAGFATGRVRRRLAVKIVREPTDLLVTTIRRTSGSPGRVEAG